MIAIIYSMEIIKRNKNYTVCTYKLKYVYDKYYAYLNDFRD